MRSLCIDLARVCLRSSLNRRWSECERGCERESEESSREERGCQIRLGVRPSFRRRSRGGSHRPLSILVLAARTERVRVAVFCARPDLGHDQPSRILQPERKVRQSPSRIPQDAHPLLRIGYFDTLDRRAIISCRLT